MPLRDGIRFTEDNRAGPGQCPPERWKENGLPDNFYTYIYFQVVAAVLRAGSGNFAPVIPDKGEHLRHQGYNIRGFVVAGQKEIEAGPASHGAEVENFRPEVRVISEKCGAQMFNSVNLRGIHHRLLVGGGHPDVEGGNAGVAHRVLPGNVDPGLQFSDGLW